jgi:cyclophilin family peptidyl-prolyl cis-trans isomerase
MQFKQIRAGLAAIAVAALSLTAVSAQGGTAQALCEAAVPAADPETRTYEAPEDVLVAGTDYRAIFCTSAGPIYIDLLEEYAPVTVNNFVFLAQNGYYNNTIFHRVIADFMAQGGDPTGTGSGGPGYQFTDEFAAFLTFDSPGWLAMANAGAGTNGSQFFITTAPATHLDYQHTIFGQVLEGQDNVLAIELRDPSVADAPATTLDTVLIVTGDESVEAQVVETDAPSADAVLESFTQLNQLWSTEGIAVSGGDTLLDADAVAASLSADQQAAAALYTDDNFQYRVEQNVSNTACDVEFSPLLSITYTLDVFADADVLTAALDDATLDALAGSAERLPADFYDTVAASVGVPLVVNSTAEHSETVMTCDDTVEATRFRTVIQRGAVLQTIELVAVDESNGLATFVYFNMLPAYEQTLRQLFRAQLR